MKLNDEFFILCIKEFLFYVSKSFIKILCISANWNKSFHDHLEIYGTKATISLVSKAWSFQGFKSEWLGAIPMP